MACVEEEGEGGEDDYGEEGDDDAVSTSSLASISRSVAGNGVIEGNDSRDGKVLITGRDRA